MKTTITTYLVDKVIGDLRAGVALGNDLARALNNRDYVDNLRANATPSDIPGLKRIALEGSIEEGNLAISLLHKFMQVEEVNQFLETQWKSSAYERRIHLLFRLLDSPRLSSATRNELRGFVKANLSRFIRDTSDWYGGPAQVLAACESRILDPSFPEEKTWVYLWIALASTDKNGVCKLLHSHMESNDPETADSAKECLEAFHHLVEGIDS